MNLDIEDPRDTDKRKYYASIDSALSNLGMPLENVALAREVAALIPHDTVYIPRHSQQYVALRASAEGRMAAHLDRGFAWVRGDLVPLLGDLAERVDGWGRVSFPVGGSREGGSTRSKRPERSVPPVCDGCYQQLPVSGRCDTCES